MTTIAIAVGIVIVVGFILTERIVWKIGDVYSRLLLMDETLRQIHELVDDRQEKLSAIASDITEIKDELLSKHGHRH